MTLRMGRGVFRSERWGRLLAEMLVSSQEEQVSLAKSKAAINEMVLLGYGKQLMGRWEMSGASDCNDPILDKVGNPGNTNNSAAKPRGIFAMHPFA